MTVCDELSVILKIYDDLKIPEAVYREIVAPEKPYSDTLGTFLTERVVKVDVSGWVVTAGGLGRGGIEAMALYKQLSADALLIDDHRARVIAEHNQIECIGALGLLLVAKRRGLISALAPNVQKLRQSSLFYGEDLLNHVLKLAGE